MVPMRWKGFDAPSTPLGGSFCWEVPDRARVIERGDGGNAISQFMASSYFMVIKSRNLVAVLE